MARDELPTPAAGQRINTADLARKLSLGEQVKANWHLISLLLTLLGGAITMGEARVRELEVKQVEARLRLEEATKSIEALKEDGRRRDAHNAGIDEKLDGLRSSIDRLRVCLAAGGKGCFDR